MAEMNAWVFYDRISELTLGLITCKLIPWAVKKLIIEIHDAIRRRREGNGDGLPPQPHENENDDYRIIDSRDFEIIIDLLAVRRVERKRFLKVIPTWKICRREIIEDLKKIAAELHKEKSNCETANYVACAAGLSGGLGKMLCTVFREIMPPWVKIIASGASATNGLIRSCTTATEHFYKEKHWKEAKAAIAKDKEQFLEMNRWFKYKSEFTDSIESAIGSNTMKKLFEMFHDFYHKVKKLKENNLAAELTMKVLTQAAELLFIHGFVGNLAFAVAGAFLQIFLIHYASSWNVNWISSASHVTRLKSVATVGMYSAHTFLSVQELKSPSSSFYSSNTAGACVGIAIDLVPALLDLKNIGKVSISEQGKKLEDVADQLKEEMEFFQRVYDELMAEADED